ncbi:MAG: DUF1850 domain-containing protein [Desulfurococcales archaeon]|nr:DUF1850 domain-containing protein [Desulfurococcales archaeon]
MIKRIITSFIFLILIATPLLIINNSIQATENIREGGNTTAPTLLIKCDNNNTIKIRIIPNKTKLSYYWIHSVEKSPIIEIYNVTSDGLILVKAEAQSFGAGHPYNSEEIGGKNFTVTNGFMVYSADYNIGKTLEILGNKAFYGSLTISSGNTTIKCENFIHAVIKIIP